MILVVVGWSWPFGEKHISLLIWLGWLLCCMAYFSFTTGLFHRYYLIMLGPPISALVGISVWALIEHWKRSPWLGWSLLGFLSGLTVLFQIYTFKGASELSSMVAIIVVGCWLVGMVILALNNARVELRSKTRPILSTVGAVLVIAALTAAPFTWSVLTTLNPNPDVALPTAGADNMSGTTFMTPNQEMLNPNGARILDYLLENTDPGAYLLSTNNARSAAPFILETGRPVFTFGGFTGGDEVIDLDGLLEMLDSGELRFILGLPQKPEIARWMRGNCEVVDIPGVRGQSEPLFDCGKNDH
jgi:4-amino-4-deoxy-L-arabinose transferase-like glycosyltransferase